MSVEKKKNDDAKTGPSPAATTPTGEDLKRRVIEFFAGTIPAKPEKATKHFWIAARKLDRNAKRLEARVRENLKRWFNTETTKDLTAEQLMKLHNLIKEEIEKEEGHE